MKYIFVTVLITALSAACGGGKAGNIFQDQTLQKIYTLQDERKGELLLPYLNHKNPGYRQAAAVACASVQDTQAIPQLTKSLADPVEAVRRASAYALGQIKDPAAEPALMKAYSREESAQVKKYILEAIGKCGTRKGLDFIAESEFQRVDEALPEGQAMGLYRFALKRIVSEAGTAAAVKLLSTQRSGDCRLFAAHYLARAGDIDLSAYRQALMDSLDAEKDVLVRMALVLALGKVQVEEVLKKLQLILLEEADYRVKVNAVRALSNFDYDKVKESLFALLKEKTGNVNIAVQASEFFLLRGNGRDAGRYFAVAREIGNWRCRSNLLAAALKYATDKKPVADFIMSAYKKASNRYEKANLLQALGGDPAACRWLEIQVFSDQPAVVKSLGMAALADMARSNKESGELKETLARIFERAVGSGDVSLVGQAAAVLRDPALNFKVLYPPERIGFLRDALGKCRLPVDIEAYLELQRTIDFFTGRETSSPLPSMINNPIDWQLVASIPPEQEIIIKTAKGDIVIQLLVNDSPGSAANFVRLIREGFYKNGRIHRVVPNFVIQDGCPRGDGWGGPDFSIRSEFGPLNYREGSVGMASAGKDTESSQWFITHSPTPHLDGRYTIFGRVISGMEVVHHLEVGDEILGFQVK